MLPNKSQSTGVIIIYPSLLFIYQNSFYPDIKITLYSTKGKGLQLLISTITYSNTFYCYNIN
jgi:hypothetical protein